MKGLTLSTALGVLLLAGCGGGSGGGGGIGVTPAPSPTPSTPTPSTPTPSTPTPSTPTPTGALQLSGAVRPVHDPAIIKDGSTYYLFATGHVTDAEGITPMRTSADLRAWALRGSVFSALPSWAATTVPGTRGLWAPDISRTNGEFRLYYSVSTFGSNRSAIGLATRATLDPTQPGAGWTDKGIVFESTTANNYNAIDPNIFNDADGGQWMAFGSFWSGIKVIRMDPATGMRFAGDSTVHSVASRPSPGAVEAPFVIRKNGYYWLFVSFDSCCQGAQSTYNTVVGRSTSPTGPYVDKDGRAMMQGGGTPILPSAQGTGERFVGRGHVAILQDGADNYIVYHAYDTQANGAPTLRIQPLGWGADGWPVAQ